VRLPQTIALSSQGSMPSLHSSSSSVIADDDSGSVSSQGSMPSLHSSSSSVATHDESTGLAATNETLGPTLTTTTTIPLHHLVPLLLPRTFNDDSSVSTVSAADTALPWEHLNDVPLDSFGYVHAVGDADDTGTSSESSDEEQDENVAAPTDTQPDQDIPLSFVMPKPSTDVPPHDPPEGCVWMHVDTGATAVVTPESIDVPGFVPIKGYCGTAEAGASSRIEGIGSQVLEFGHGPKLPSLLVPMENVLLVPAFSRRSLSAHALLKAGFECDHRVREDGSYLWIRRVGSDEEFHFPLTTAHGTDFIAVRVNPHVTTSEEISHKVSLIHDVSKHMSSEALFVLLHLRLGCAPVSAIKAMKDGNVDGFPQGVEIPESFQCPICLVQKNVALPRGHSIPKSIPRKGVRYAADFAFVKTASIRGYTCFLVLVEEDSSYLWFFARRSKQPPVSLLKWFIADVRKKLGHKFRENSHGFGGGP
jgi:hypothetical protein